MVFWRPGVPRQKNTHSLKKNSGRLALPPSAARPRNHNVLENVWLFGRGTSGLQKTTLAKNNFGIPLIQPRREPRRKTIRSTEFPNPTIKRCPPLLYQDWDRPRSPYPCSVTARMPPVENASFNQPLFQLLADAGEKEPVSKK